ncbi:MAG: hypothetical protein AVDCRST_MAG85-2575, partial [uncultured Solirubrobacteraceae bacterium]
PRWARRRSAPPGRRPRRDRRRAALQTRRPGLPAPRPGLHLGHRAVADHDALGARGGLRRGRHGLPPRGAARAARSVLPDLLGRRGASPGLRRRPRPDEGAAREVLAARRRALRRLHGRDEADLRAGHPRRRPARVLLVPRARALHADDGQARRRAAAVPLGRQALRAPADPRGVLVPLAVHRRRPVSRPGDLRRAGLPPVRRGRLVRPRRRLLDRRGDGALTRRALRREGRAGRALRRARDRRRARVRRGPAGRRRRLERRRAQDARAARPAGAVAPAASDDVVLPALPRDRQAVSEAAAPHAHGRRRLQALHPRRDARGAPPLDVLDLPARAVADRAGDGGRRRRLDLHAAAGAQPALGDRLGRGGIAAARRADRGLRDDVRPHRPVGLGHRRAPHDARRLRARARRRVGERVRGRADAAPVGCVPAAQPRPHARGDVLRRRRHASGRGAARRAARRRGHRRTRRRGCACRRL